MHGGREHCCRCCFGGTIFKIDVEFFKNFMGIAEYIYQMRNWCTLVATDVGNTRLQQALSDGQDAFAAKFCSRTKSELLNFLGK